VKLVASIRTPEQAVLMRDTLERCNAGGDWLAAATKTRRQFDLHKLAYAALRARFGRSAQAAVRCIAKVADSLKAGDKKTRRRFRRRAAQPYDERIVRFLPGKDAVLIGTLTARPCIPFAYGGRQRDLLEHAKSRGCAARLHPRAASSHSDIGVHEAAETGWADLFRDAAPDKAPGRCCRNG
jgi:putative transposase